ncbi:MAG: hypothetical protein H5T69_18490, partial [Chloroflexi bacterium]|nr:hypothetical protein [Chloroflexota bacterium]
RKGTLYAENESAPLGDLWLPLSDGTLASHDLDVTPEMLDVDRAAGSQWEPGPLITHGDRFATSAPYSRVPWVEAILGTPIRATIRGGSMRTKAFIASWEEWEQKETHRHEGWFDVLKRLMELVVERANGRLAPVHTLMRGPSDLAEAVVGPELMSYSIYDNPAALERFLDEATDTFIEVLEAQIERTPKLRGGYVNPFGIWAPGRVVRTQCDATAFLSAEHYARWFLPYDVRICEAVDYSMIHLHSVSLHTVPRLLEVERPHGIQITLEDEASGPPLAEMIPIFREILGSKPLLIDGPLTEDEVKLLQDILPSDGLAIYRRIQPW